MKGRGQTTATTKSRVVEVDSEESWDFHLSQAHTQGRLVFAHFAACWCAPSVAMIPFFEKLACRHPGILFVSVDMDKSKAVARRMEVKATPTFLLIRRGKIVATLVGANPEQIRRHLEIFLVSGR